MIPEFRVWDKKTERMWDIETWHIADEYVDLIEPGKSVADISAERFWRKQSEIILMQSTGLKDKNGVEIFEGDIIVGQQYLTTDLMTPFEIKGLVKYSEKNTMFYLGEKSVGHDISMYSLGSSIYQYEIIGNIYEQPDSTDRTRKTYTILG